MADPSMTGYIEQRQRVLERASVPKCLRCWMTSAALRGESIPGRLPGGAFLEEEFKWGTCVSESPPCLEAKERCQLMKT